MIEATNRNQAARATRNNNARCHFGYTETLRGQLYGCMGRIWIPTGCGCPQKNTTLILGKTLLCLQPTSAIVFERLFDVFDVEFCYSEIVIETPLKHSPRSGNFLLHLENTLRQFARLNICKIHGIFAIRFFVWRSQIVDTAAHVAGDFIWRTSAPQFCVMTISA